MRFLRSLAVVALPILVAGCYTSAKPLITADKAVFPYEKIVYADSADKKPLTLTHEGDAYVQTTDKGEKVQLLFMPVRDDLYVVQFGGDVGTGSLLYLYGLVKLDAAGKSALTYVSVADKSDAGPGLELCPDNGSICLTDLQPYVDHALKLFDAGATPESGYQITELQ